MKNYMLSGLIGGVWAENGVLVETINPSDISKVSGTYFFQDEKAVELAAEAAKAAFKTWSVLPALQRSRYLSAIAEELAKRKSEMAHIIATEQGKPIIAARIEAQRAVDIFQYYAGEVLRSTGEILESVRPDICIEISREPVGVFALITPWNFPIVIPAWKVAAALAYGNTVVLKPSEVTPGAACILASCIQAANVPPGTFNMLLGTGPVLGSTLATHQDIAGISFTGSVATGKKILMSAIPTHKKVQLEMGGKNPLVVLDDADVDVAVASAIDSAFLYSGQRCTAASRIIVTPGIYDEFLEKLLIHARHLHIGHALDEASDMGPVVNNEQLQKNLAYIEMARQEGGTTHGGKRCVKGTQGYFLEPCIVTDLDNTARVCREEIFGPVTCVIRARDYEAALEIANDTPYGLASGICTTSLKHVSHFKRHARSGIVSVNTSPSGVDFHVPFGGTKASSYGSREQGRYAAEFFTTVKTVYQHV